MGDYDFFLEPLDRVFDDVDLSPDQKLDHIAGLLDRLDPTLLENAADWADEEIEQAFLELVNIADPSQETSHEKFLAALVGLAELKRRADRVGMRVRQYRGLFRIRLELGDV